VFLAGIAAGIGCLVASGFLLRSGLLLYRRPVRSRTAPLWRPGTDAEPPTSDFDRGRLTGGMLSFFVGVMLLTGAEARRVYPAVPAALKWTCVSSIYAIMLLGALHVSVMLFNRPGFLVPPILRNAPGTVGKARKAAKAGRAGTAGKRGG